MVMDTRATSPNAVPQVPPSEVTRASVVSGNAMVLPLKVVDPFVVVVRTIGGRGVVVVGRAVVGRVVLRSSQRPACITKVSARAPTLG